MRAARTSGRARTGDKICGVVRSSLRRATGRNFIYTYSASFLLNTAFRFTSYLALTSPCLTLPYPSSPRRSPLPSPCRGSSRFAAPLPPSSSVRRPTSSTRSASSPGRVRSPRFRTSRSNDIAKVLACTLFESYLLPRCVARLNRYTNTPRNR